MRTTINPLQLSHPIGFEGVIFDGVDKVEKELSHYRSIKKRLSGYGYQRGELNLSLIERAIDAEIIPLKAQKKLRGKTGLNLKVKAMDIAQGYLGRVMYGCEYHEELGLLSAVSGYKEVRLDMKNEIHLFFGRLMANMGFYNGLEGSLMVGISEDSVHFLTEGVESVMTNIGFSSVDETLEYITGEYGEAYNVATDQCLSVEVVQERLRDDVFAAEFSKVVSEFIENYEFLEPCPLSKEELEGYKNLKAQSELDKSVMEFIGKYVRWVKSGYSIHHGIADADLLMNEYEGFEGICSSVCFVQNEFERSVFDVVEDYYMQTGEAFKFAYNVDKRSFKAIKKIDELLTDLDKIRWD